MAGAFPIIYNVMNFAKPPDGKPALLSLDEARTLFHEFGHALHGMLSDVDLAVGLRHRRLRAISSNCPRSSTSTG